MSIWSFYQKESIPSECWFGIVKSFGIITVSLIRDVDNLVDYWIDEVVWWFCVELFSYSEMKNLILYDL
jgi:hypothetical protein